MKPEIGFASTAYLLSMLKLLSRVQSNVTEPYMDEVFHVPQNQRICNFSLEWDPKITTLPGVYVLTTLVYTPLRYLGVNEPCSLAWLRMWNVFMSVGTLIMSYAIMRQTHRFERREKLFLNALNMTLFPVGHFFSFLFYTDPTANLLMLTMHFYWLRKKFNVSACYGFLSVFARQTNIVWCFLHGVLTFDYILRRHEITSLSSLWDFRKLLSIMQESFKFCGGYFLIGISFIAFVIWNKGIAVGDRDAHQISLNVPQLLYFSLFTATFTFPFILARVYPAIIRMRIKHVYILEMITLICIWVIYRNTVAHPYLLADNRHYTFYLWKRLMEWYPTVRYLLIPSYITGWVYILKSYSDRYFVSGLYLFCCALCLAPQLLLEFRYFVPPFYLFRIKVRKTTWLELIMELALYTTVNIVTFNLFVYGAFKWPNSDKTQRFMW